MDKPVKSNGIYDGRSKEGRQSKGKPLHPKKTEQEMNKALGNKKKK